MTFEGGHSGFDMTFMGSPVILSVEEAKDLTDELCVLTKVQTEAVHTGTYIKITDNELKQYDKRASRISEICRLLRRFESEKGLRSSPLYTSSVAPANLCSPFASIARNDLQRIAPLDLSREDNRD
jgi:hypothetical protein